MTTSNPLYLKSGSSWNTVQGASVTQTFAYLESLPNYYPVAGETGFLAELNSARFVNLANDPGWIQSKENFSIAREAWKAVAGIEWSTASTTAKQITFGYANPVIFPLVARPDGTTVLADGVGFYPGSPTFLFSGDIWLSAVPKNVGTGLNPGTQAFSLLMHELGHALGLAHAGPSGAIPSDTSGNPAATVPGVENTTRYTVMSYAVDPAGFHPITPMVHDIAAIQILYGKSATANGGASNGLFTSWKFTDTSHPFSSSTSGIFNNPGKVQMTLWSPTGRQDTVDAIDLTTPVLINLRPGEYSAIGTGEQIPFGGNFFSSFNVGIAFGAEIERAFGTNKNDTLIGNHLANLLQGNDGEDTLDGGVASTAGVANSSVPAGAGDSQPDVSGQPAA